MGIQVADNFNYQGQKPLDARLSFNTINSMVSVSSAILYDGCLSYVKENKKYYTYDSNNEIDVTLGRWREYQSGGSSNVQDLDDLSDVAITSPTTNQVLKWDGTKWVNSNDEGEFIVVQELPSSGKAKAIYLVPNSSQESGNYYDEYIYINSAWEHIGTSQVDLSNYYNKQEVDSALSGKVDKVSGKGLSTEDYSSAEKTKLGNIESGAEVNVINSIKLNGASQTITNKEVDLRVQELPSGGATGQSLVKSSSSDYDVEWANTENVQLSELPTASAEYVDKIYQYVGETSQNYVNGKYYKCVLVEEHLCWRYYESGYSEVKVWTIGKPSPIVLYSDSACTSVRNYSSASYKSDSQMSIQFPGESWGRNYNRYSSSDYNVYAWQQVNVGADIKVNGVTQQFVNGSYDIPVPTKTSDLDNDSDYVTLNDFLIDNQVSENTTYSSSKIESLVASGSGHTIQDSTGTDMNARDNLQFGESLNVTDDSENDATVVDEYELTNADIEEILSELPSPLSGGNKGCIPCGKVEAFYRETAPDGYLVCDGTEYAKADYPKLASILLGLTEHTQYEGSDENHFKVPDLRGEFLRGSGTNSHTNQGDGASVGVHQDGTEHVDVWTRQTIIGTMYDSGGTTGSNTRATNYDSKHKYDSVGYNQITNANSVSENASAYYTSRPTNTSVLFCIAYKDIFLTTELPVLFDERSTEQPIGKYVRSDGKWKPVYKKTYITTTPNSIDTQNWMAWFDVSSLNIDTFIGYSGTHTLNNIIGIFSEESWKLSYKSTTGYIQIFQAENWMKNVNSTLNIEYTKTSDEWR